MRYFQKEIDRHSKQINQNEINLQQVVVHSADELDYRYNQRRQMDYNPIFPNDSLVEPAPKINWEKLVDTYWRDPVIIPSATLQLEDYHHFRPLGKIISQTGFLHLQIPYNFTQVADQMMTTCACYERIQSDLNQTSAFNNRQNHQSVVRGMTTLPSLNFGCHEAQSDVRELIHLFGLSPDPSASRHNLFKKFYIKSFLLS